MSGDDLVALYRSGAVRRYHTNVAMAHLGQTNADHQGRCVQLLLALHPAPSVALIRAVALHDVGEAVVGDLPALFKRDAPDFAACHAEIEAGARIAILGADPLDRADRAGSPLDEADRRAGGVVLLRHPCARRGAPGRLAGTGGTAAAAGLGADR